MANNSDDENVTVRLYKKGGVDWLEFCTTPAHSLNLNKDDQEKLKGLFCDLIKKMKDNNITLELEIAKDYDNSLMKEVAADYIKDLNEELKSARTDFLNDIGDSGVEL